MTADHPTLHDRLAKIQDILLENSELKTKEKKTIERLNQTPIVVPEQDSEDTDAEAVDDD